jgi:hypothetical protein
MVYVLKSNFCYSLSVAAPGRSEDTDCFSNLDKLLLMKERSFAVSGLQLESCSTEQRRARSYSALQGLLSSLPHRMPLACQ